MDIQTGFGGMHEAAPNYDPPEFGIKASNALAESKYRGGTIGAYRTAALLQKAFEVNALGDREQGSYLGADSQPFHAADRCCQRDKGFAFTS